MLRILRSLLSVLFPSREHLRKPVWQLSIRLQHIKCLTLALFQFISFWFPPIFLVCYFSKLNSYGKKFLPLFLFCVFGLTLPITTQVPILSFNQHIFTEYISHATRCSMHLVYSSTSLIQFTFKYRVSRQTVNSKCKNKMGTLYNMLEEDKS